MMMGYLLFCVLTYPIYMRYDIRAMSLLYTERNNIGRNLKQ